MAKMSTSPSTFLLGFLWSGHAKSDNAAAEPPAWPSRAAHAFPSSCLLNLRLFCCWYLWFSCCRLYGWVIHACRICYRFCGAQEQRWEEKGLSGHMALGSLHKNNLKGRRGSMVPGFKQWETTVSFCIFRALFCTRFLGLQAFLPAEGRWSWEQGEGGHRAAAGGQQQQGTAPTQLLLDRLRGQNRLGSPRGPWHWASGTRPGPWPAGSAPAATPCQAAVSPNSWY